MEIAYACRQSLLVDNPYLIVICMRYDMTKRVVSQCMLGLKASTQNCGIVNRDSTHYYADLILRNGELL